MKQLAVSNKLMIDMGSGEKAGDSILAILKGNGHIYFYNGERWLRTQDEPAHCRAITLSKIGLYCLGGDGRVYRWNENSEESEWAYLGLDSVVGLGCDAAGNLWCLGTDGKLYRNTAEFVGYGSISGEVIELRGVWSTEFMPDIPK